MCTRCTPQHAVGDCEPPAGGDTVREAVDFGLNLYGADDIIWYNNQGGRRPHAVASFPVLSGDQDARLRAVQAAADSTQQAA